MTDIKSLLRQTIDSQIANDVAGVKDQLATVIQNRARAMVQESMARSYNAPNYSHGDGTTATFVDFYDVQVDGSESKLLLSPGSYEINEVQINYTVSGRRSPATRFEPAEEPEFEFTVDRVVYTPWDDDREEFGEPQTVSGPEAEKYVPSAVYRSIYDQLVGMAESQTGPFSNDY